VLQQQMMRQQQVQALVLQQLVVDQRQQVQVVPLQADLLFYFLICSSIKRQILWNTVYLTHYHIHSNSK
jgi:hypothetical protein